MREFTVLPMAFGALFRTEDDIVELIRGTYDALRDVLTKMEGKVEFGLKVAKIPKERRQQLAIKYLEVVGLAQFAESFTFQLSGGMKQRVAIARALALEPEILLMDEPFAALDVQTRELMYDELLGIHKTTGKTIIFVTHNINEAILLGDRVIVLSPRTGGIKSEFSIGLPRPRDVDSPELAIIKRQILKELEEDFKFARSETRTEEAV